MTRELYAPPSDLSPFVEHGRAFGWFALVGVVGSVLALAWAVELAIARRRARRTRDALGAPLDVARDLPTRGRVVGRGVFATGDRPRVRMAGGVWPFTLGRLERGATRPRSGADFDLVTALAASPVHRGAALSRLAADMELWEPEDAAHLARRERVYQLTGDCASTLAMWSA